MTSYVISTSQTTTETLSSNYDDLLVTSAGSIIDTTVDADGVDAEGSDQEITIDGLVYSLNGYSNTAVNIAGSLDVLTINGQVQGDTGVGVEGVIDHIYVGSQGAIDGGNWGVIFVGNSGTPSETGDTLDNGGDISGEVGVEAEFGGGDTIDNSGQISGQSGVVLFGNIAAETVENSGTITGGSGGAINTSSSSVGIDVVNSGLLSGSGASAAGSETALLAFNDNSDTTSTIDNTGSISGLGYVIQSSSDILDIANSGTIHGGLYSVAGAQITNSGLWQASAGSATVFSLSTGNDSITNSHKGSIVGGISLVSGDDTITNAGRIDGPVKFTGNKGGNHLTNSGDITGNVTLTQSSTAANHGQIYGDVALGAVDTLTNTGTIHGNVTLGAKDTFNLSSGLVTGIINASTSDLFELTGDFGKVTFDDFVAGSGATHDTIQFAANDFASFAKVQAASSQVGADVVIKLDATDSITLNNVTLGNLVSGDFKFV